MESKIMNLLGFLQDSDIPAEFPVVIFEESNGKGRPWMITPETGQVFISGESVFVPYHMILHLWNHKNQVIKIPGGSIISNLNHLLLFWGNIKLDTSKIVKMEVHRIMSWFQYLHDIASSNTLLFIGETKISVNNDKLFDTLCSNREVYSFAHCECFLPFIEFKVAHPQTMSYVNLINTNCNSNIHYVPKDALTGNEQMQCDQMFASMLKNRTLLPFEKGGPEEWFCNNVKYENRMIPDRNKRLDDFVDKQIESQEMPGWPTWILILLLVCVVTIMTLAVCRLGQMYREKKLNFFIFHE